MQLILQPCSDADARKHYVDTIQNPVPIDRVLPLLPPSERQAVEATFPTSVAVWGVTPGKSDVNARKWDRIAVGDTAMLYRDRAFFFRGTIAYKVHAPELALDLWGARPDGATWEYVFFLSDLEAVEIAIERFNAAAGYADNYIVQGFNVLDSERSENILNALELEPGVGAMLPTPVDIDAAKVALAKLSGSLDMQGSTRRRKEQVHLRTILLGSRTSERCAICSRELPVDLLVIGHIRKRHSCSDTQKKDLANVMPVCLLGCDTLFENGYIYVDQSGVVRTDHANDHRTEVRFATSKIVGLQCRAWTPTSAPYFEWHRTNPRRFA